MRKLTREPGFDATGAPRRSLASRLMPWVLIALVSPIIFEAAKLCFADWTGMIGARSEVATPVLDAIRAWKDDLAVNLTRVVRSYFVRLPWKVSMVVPIACGWALFASLLLRRR